MRKVLQVDTGEGFNNLTSEFYAAGDTKAEAVAQKKVEKQRDGWSKYHDFQHAQFRIVETL